MRYVIPAALGAVASFSRAASGATRKVALLQFFLAALLTGGAETALGQSTLSGFDPNPNGPVRVVVVQSDGKILLGGDFTTLAPNGGAVVTRNHIARLNPDGTFDTAFDPNVLNNSAFVASIIVQADGKVLIGGDFDSVAGQPRNNIARLDSTTGLPDSFDPSANGTVQSLAVQADGKIIVGGAFTSIGGQTRNNISRLDATTGLADSFDPNADSGVRSIVVQSDGKILVGGAFGGIGGQTRGHIARLDPATGLADSFDPNANNEVQSIAVQADGKILAGGAFGAIGGQTRNLIARLDATTGLADSFDPHASDQPIPSSISSIAVQADGKILTGGSFTAIGGQAQNNIARLNPITGLADSFPSANGAVSSIAVQADGKILAGGFFAGANSIGKQTRNFMARLETDGRLDQALDFIASEGLIRTTALQQDGKILVGGSFVSNSPGRIGLARLNTDGTVDDAFNPDPANGSFNVTIDSIAVQADGKILVSGAFTTIGGQSRNGLARLDATTGLADSFDPNANGAMDGVADVIVVQADGKIIVGGSFSSIGGQLRGSIARLDPSTGSVDSFNPRANGFVASIVVQTNGMILVGGSFTRIGGQNRNYIARLDPTTGLADSFDANAQPVQIVASEVSTIAVQADGKILAAGYFSAIGGQGRSWIARIDPASGLADSFDPTPNGPVYSIAVQADGKILVSGDFTSIAGQSRGHIARLDATTGLADSFDPNFSGDAESIALQADGKILASETIDGLQSSHLVRLSNDTAALQNFAVTQRTITWARGGSGPQFTRVAIEYSADNVNYVFLGNAMAAGNNWTLAGLNLSTAQNIYVRGRGYYRSGSDNGSESTMESVRIIPKPSTLGNISTRLSVQTGDNAMIGGFIITGTDPKTVVVRGLGPSLAVKGALGDPTIEVHGASGELLASNDNWRDAANVQQIIDSGLAPHHDLESAFFGIINPGAYTVVVRGVDNTTGIGLFDVYDLDQTANSTMSNISTRGFVDTNDNVMIAGTIVLGQTSQRVLVRAIGPSLAVPGKLEDPYLELRDSNGVLIRSNDNWRSDQEAEIMATTIPPNDDLESAIIQTLPSDGAAYTAIVRGTNGTTGVAVVEVYALN